MNSMQGPCVPCFISLFIGTKALEMSIKLLSVFCFVCYTSVLGTGVDLASGKLDCLLILLEMSPCPLLTQITPEFQEEVMCILRRQQQELSWLRQNQMELVQRVMDHISAIQSSLMGHMERLINSQQEQSRILLCKCWVVHKKWKPVGQARGMKEAQKVQASW